MTYNLTSFLSVWLSSLIFSTTLRIWFRLPHHSIVSIFWCMCTHPIDLMGIHLLRYVHGNEGTWIHDVVRDTFVAIMWDVDFHVGWKQLHAFPSTTFNFFCRRIDIVLAKDGICTLVDVVIVDPMQTNLFPWFYATQRFATFDVIQIKERNYHDRHPTNQFLPLAIEIFGCLYKQVDVFLHDCANTIWNLKTPKGPLLHQKISITLPRMQASSILS